MSNQELLNLLLGEWSGTGRGEFPTIESFEYLETLVFSADGRPFLHYEQKTKRRNPGQTDYIPSHWESGFFRSLPDGQVELTGQYPEQRTAGEAERLARAKRDRVDPARSDLERDGLELFFRSWGCLNMLKQPHLAIPSPWSLPSKSQRGKVTAPEGNWFWSPI